MAKSNIVIKNIKLTVSQEELDLITDALNLYVEDMETDLRKWYIKYMRLATQLNRLNNKLTCMDKLHWRGTHQRLPRAK
jgi:hypothetical protein